ncbi:MAG TPA: methylmalonyl-CoA epimerase [Longimicrobiales bacterium]|nr:methylmalonyl-CoA epimerase [Longimicrobiales bacterium]
MNPSWQGDLPLDHVGIAVSSIEDAARLFELVSGQAGSPSEELPSQGVRVAFCGQVELLEPLGPDTTVGRFLERRGQSIHHIAYRSDNLQADLDRLAAQGVELIDVKPRPGARGHLVAFVHPRSTGGILVELVQQT